MAVPTEMDARSIASLTTIPCLEFGQCTILFLFIRISLFFFSMTDLVYRSGISKCHLILYVLRLGGDATAGAGGNITDVEELRLQLQRANAMIEVLQQSKQSQPAVPVDSVSWLSSKHSGEILSKLVVPDFWEPYLGDKVFTVSGFFPNQAATPGLDGESATPSELKIAEEAEAEKQKKPQVKLILPGPTGPLDSDPDNVRAFCDKWMTPAEAEAAEVQTPPPPTPPPAPPATPEAPTEVLPPTVGPVKNGPEVLGQLGAIQSSVNTSPEPEDTFMVEIEAMVAKGGGDEVRGPPPSQADVAPKVNWSTHKNEGMRLTRMMDSNGESFPHMKKLWDSNKKDWVVFEIHVLRKIVCLSFLFIIGSFKKIPARTAWKCFGNG